MLTFNDLIVAFETLGLQKKPVIVHASLRSFGKIQGGPDAVVTSLAYSTGAFIMPTHTYKSMVTPVSGPANNGLNYARGQQWNRLSEPFRSDMPADRMMGVIPESMRHWPEARRSMHPILSFAGFRAEKILKTQTIEEPFAPLRALVELDGWVLLLGVDHTVNTTVHYAEKLAGRRQFIRWALTENGIVACPGFPGDSSGFKVLEKDMLPHTKKLQVGNALVQAMPMKALLSAVMERLKKNPKDLLCSDISCARCNEIRR